MADTLKKDMTVFEVSYEVCNKFGGIYTVITSKMARMMDSLQNYIAIGPYYKDKASLSFDEEKPPLNFQKAFNSLHKKHGINCYYGRWMIHSHELMKERPVTILIDPAGFRERINDIKGELWDYARVDSMTNDWWYDEPLPWSYACGLLIEELIKSDAVKGKVAAHFHEFLTGAGLLYLKKNKIPVGTVFTTHATMLGRTIAGTGREDIHSLVKGGLSKKETISDDKAKEYKVFSKHSLERASARKADVFTTVSDVTKKECEYVLGRRPDVILYNGLDMNKFPTMEELSNLHVRYRNHIRKFLSAYFSPYYPMDTQNTLFYFISGRFEFRNKGIDLLLDALGRLNSRLGKEKSKTNIVVFIWVPCKVKDRRSDVMDNLALYEDLEETVRNESNKITQNIMNAFALRRPMKQTQIFDDTFLQHLKKAELKLRRQGQNPPVSPFIIDPNDITQRLERNALMNRKDDKVKVVYYPTYLSSTDGMLGLDYYNAMMACHVGIFPSYYEPWGYTPLEAAALGCQSITTDLAGYGMFMKPRLKKGEYSIVVVPRESKGYEESVAYLENIMFRIYCMKKSERGLFKIKAKQLSKLADWRSMIKNYLKAYDIALSKG